MLRNVGLGSRGSAFEIFMIVRTNYQMTTVTLSMVGLDGLIFAQQFLGACIDQQEDVFQNALADLTDYFLGEKEKRDPLSDKLAHILN